MKCIGLAKFVYWENFLKSELGAWEEIIVTCVSILWITHQVSNESGALNILLEIYISNNNFPM